MSPFNIFELMRSIRMAPLVAAEKAQANLFAADHAPVGQHANPERNEERALLKIMGRRQFLKMRKGRQVTPD